MSVTFNLQAIQLSAIPTKKLYVAALLKKLPMKSGRGSHRRWSLNMAHAQVINDTFHFSELRLELSTFKVDQID